MSIIYSITGSLPASWEDFLSRDGCYPNVTIMTKAESDADEAKVGVNPDETVTAALADAPSDSKWLDIVVDVPTITEDVARLAIAKAIGIDNPEEIVLEQMGVCESV